MTKDEKEHKGSAFTKQIFCNANPNANGNDAEMSKQKFLNGSLILLEIGHLDQI